MFILGLLASVLVLAGWIWNVVIAFKNGDIIWGIISIPCGIVALVYGAMHFAQCKTPTLMMAGGMVLSLISGAMQVPQLGN